MSRSAKAAPATGWQPPAESPGPIAPPLLTWYHAHRRILPFREDPVPYHIWVSEIMLQQTRVSAALPYYERFMRELPSIAALAACDEERLQKLWQGLGYYSRARNLQKAARLVVEQYGGALPADYDALCTLPGIGAYTAGAIASIAFGLPVVAVDGNVLRVFSRLYNCDADVMKPATRTGMAALVQTQQPADAPGDFNQALMELGALVCLPGAPRCGECPLAEQCLGRKAGRAAQLPVKAAPAAKRSEALTVLVVHRPDGAVLLHRRPEKGLLAGLWEPLLLPGHPEQTAVQAELCARIPGARLEKKLEPARHIFTHRIWQMEGWLGSAGAGAPAPDGFVWATAAELAEKYPVPAAFAGFAAAMRGTP